MSEFETDKHAKKTQRLEKRLERRISKAELKDVGEALKEDLRQTVAKFTQAEKHALDRVVGAFSRLPHEQNDRTLTQTENKNQEDFLKAAEDLRIASLYAESSKMHYGIYQLGLDVLEKRGQISEQVHRDAQTMQLGMDNRAVRKMKKLIDKIEDVKGEPLEGMKALQLLQKNPDFKLEPVQKKKTPLRQI